MTFDRLNQNWQQMKEQSTIWLTINDDLTVAKDKSECTNDIDSQLHHGLTDKWPVTLTNQVNTALRWLNTVLAVCEYTSFAKSRQEKGCSSQAETWQVKIYWWKSLTERSNVTFSWFPWQHERLNTTCDLLATTFSTVHRSKQTKNHAALPLARLDLSQSAKNWYDFTTQYYKYLSLSAFCFFLCFPITFFF